jgi:hypothetical protein
MKKRNIKEYISGYVDGEGCFNISFSKREKLKIGWETKPSFSVSQNEERSEILYKMKNFFKVGFLRRDFSDKTLKYEIRSLDDLNTKIIPHFESYPLLSSKNKDFKLFKIICFLMKKDGHKNKAGLKKIIKFAFKMNPGGKRKYSKQDILKTLR